MTDEFFDVDLYIKIRQKRKEIGLPIFDDLYPDNGRIYDHQLEGKKLICKSNNNEYYIQSVHKHWYRGWYIVLLIYRLIETENDIFVDDIIDGKKYGRSHCAIIWQNINCHDEITLKHISENNVEFELL